MKIQLENLTLERPGGVRALNGITLDFDSDPAPPLRSWGKTARENPRCWKASSG